MLKNIHTVEILLFSCKNSEPTLHHNNLLFSWAALLLLHTRTNNKGTQARLQLLNTDNNVDALHGTYLVENTAKAKRMWHYAVLCWGIPLITPFFMPCRNIQKWLVYSSSYFRFYFSSCCHSCNGSYESADGSWEIESIRAPRLFPKRFYNIW